VLPADGSDVRFRQDRCESSSNAGGGVVIEVPSASRFHYRGSDVVCSRNNADGFGFSISPQAILQAELTGCAGNNNKVDGVSVVCPEEGPVPGLGSSLTLRSCVFSGNAGMGARSLCPVYGEGTQFCENSIHGLAVGSNDPNLSIGSVTRCVFERNGGHGITTDVQRSVSNGPRGRFSPGPLCQINDNLGDGILWQGGCLLVSGVEIGRNGGNGITCLGTLNIDSSSIRRSGGWGLITDGTRCVATEVTFELNGRIPDLGGGGALIQNAETATLERCVFNGNATIGLRCDNVQGALTRVAVNDCVASGNGTHGILLQHCTGELVRSSTSGNDGWGVAFGAGSVRLRCAQNSSIDNGGGFVIDASNCLVVNNTATAGLFGAYEIAPGNAVAPIRDAAGLVDCNPNTNFIF
jgi:hypothetical protein